MQIIEYGIKNSENKPPIFCERLWQLEFFWDHFRPDVAQILFCCWKHWNWPIIYNKLLVAHHLFLFQ